MSTKRIRRLLQEMEDSQQARDAMQDVLDIEAAARTFEMGRAASQEERILMEAIMTRIYVDTP